MDKKNYLDLLKYYLKDLPDNVIEDIIIDYDQHFAEGVQNGKTEEQISKELGRPEYIAREYLRFEPNIRRKVKANSDNMADKNENKTLKYILIAVGLIVLSPVILGVLSSIVGLIVGAFILSIALVVGGIAIVFALIAGAGATFLGTPITILSLHPVSNFLMFLFFVALGIFIFLLTLKFVQWLIKTFKNLYISMKWRLEK